MFHPIQNPELEVGPAPGFPLSCAQESLWFVEQMVPGTALYNMPEGWRFRGRLDYKVFKQSLQALVDRHETLRTTLTSVDGTPRQLISSHADVDFEITDLAHSSDPEAAARCLMEEDAKKPFDLTRGPLLRVQLFRLGPGDHFLLLNMHHIISDAVSFGIFMRELSVLYGAFAKGQASPLRELPVQYADFAVWQREWLHSDSFREQLAYWKAQLADPIAPLPLPADRPRPLTETHRGATQFFSFPKSLTDRLKALSAGEQTTLFMTVMAAFATLLHRYSGQVDIVVGSPFSGRDRVEIEGLIGFFINTHALRFNLAGNPTFLELLRRVRQNMVAAYANQSVPFEQVVKTLQPDRKAGRAPLFQAVLGLQTAFTEQWLMPGLETTRIELETSTSKFDWTLLLTETSKDLGLRFEYRTDLFDSATITRAAGHFERILEQVAATPNKKISELQLLTEAERRLVLQDWNQTESVYERDQAVHQVFEARAKAEPEAVALVCDGAKWSYSELNRCANRWARRLQHFGVTPGMPVGICIRRSPELIIGLLAILKAGGAYVPLDRSYPAERLTFMIQDCGVRVVLADEAFDGAGIGDKTLQVVRFSQLQADPADEGDVGVRPSPESTAYIMYTSGSTGKPKGTAINHRAIVRLVRNTNYIEILPADVLLQLAPISFDASTFEIWGALLNGARLAIGPAEAPALRQLGEYIRTYQVTILWLTAGLFHQMVDHELESLAPLRYLLAGGDCLSMSHVLKARRALRRGTLINGYGPTENTTFSCCYRVPPDWPGAVSVPIGKPISNSRAYVLDANLEPVPIGIPGELFVGGDGLANGYINRPALDQERFILSPFQDFSHERLYRTGDLVRWLADGNLEFLGRLDDQVKIRGFRVEPAEIEAALRECPGVRQAVVTPYLPDHGHRCLVAYVVPVEQSGLSNDSLREFLGARLPSYMIPAHFVQLEALPLNSNGKVDRQVLPSPDPSESLRHRVQVAPRNPTESTLASIWTELLGVKAISVHDNFFHLGGHSLLATQVISRIAKTLQAAVPVRALFEMPTIAELAQVVSRAQKEKPAQAPIPKRSGRSDCAQLRSQIDQLSDTEVELLLSRTRMNSSKR